jgi:hypothetical protein
MSQYVPRGSIHVFHKSFQRQLETCSFNRASCHLSKVHFDGRISSLDCRQSTNLARNPGLGMKATFRPNESRLSFRWCFVGITRSVSVIGECESGEDIYAKNNSRPVTTESSDLAPRSSGNQNCGFQGVCVDVVTPFVV